jgi:transmembrane sensor
VSASPNVAAAPIPSAIASIREYDGTPLSEVLEQANAGGGVHIQLANPVLGGRAVSGRFRIDNPDKLAERLAWIFDLRVDRSAPDAILLRENEQMKKK